MARLDRVEQLAPGAGKLDLSAYLRGNQHSALAGLQLDLEKRIGKRGGVFTSGRVGTSWTRGAGIDLDYEVLAGLRYNF